MATARHLATGMTADAVDEIGASTTVQVVDGPGWVFAMSVNGNGGAGEVILVDSRTAATPIKWRLTAASGATFPIPFPIPIRCETGVRVITSTFTRVCISYKAE